MTCEAEPKSFVLKSTERFDVKKSVSGGGCGDVWVAFDNTLASTVAIKRIFNWAAEMPLLQAEVIAGRKIHSPHVLRIYDLIKLQGSDCIVMDYVEGKTLRETLKNGTLPAEKAKTLIHQLCLGVAAIHKAGYAHCDLKPLNILVNCDGKLVIVDLGLAELLRKTRINPSPYRAPELNAPCHAIADIYAIGGLMAEIAAAGQLQSGSDNNWLAPIIGKCQNSDPQRRYSTVADLLQDLEPKLLRNPKVPAADGWTTKQKIATCLTLVILAVSVAMARTYRRSSIEPSQVIVISKTDDLRAHMVVDLIASYLETQRFAVSCPPKQRNERAVLNIRSSAKPLVVSVAVESRDGRPGIRLELSTQPKAAFVKPYSSQVISDLITYIGRELNLPKTHSSYEISTKSESFGGFAEAWHRAEINPAIEGALFQQSIPVLLLKAKAGSHLFSLTASQESKESAMTALENLKANGVTTSQTTLLRAGILFRQGNSADAIHLLQSSLRTLSTTAPIYRTLSDSQLRGGFAVEALESATRAVAQDRLSPRVYMTLARAQIVLGKDDDAIKSLKTALDLKEDATTHTTLGNLYILLGRFSDAERHLERALEIQPTAEGSIYLGLSQILSGNTQQGMLVLNGSASLKPTLYSLGILGAALRWQGDFSTANLTLKRAVKLGHEASSDAIELGRLAVIHAQLANIRKADELIKRAQTYMSSGQTELIYDAMVVDAFANRRKQCAEKFELLKDRRFPTSFATRDPQIAKVLNLPSR